eukprot:TRINITY_DN11601_c0_g2_i1.p1 TRINITY_DN11601_c0_g2~~TRINITY_DN11601_c0_g2_i1.p1  ORF type:complete len:550 (+),score=79.73 TRINITY_DN11601_c0_g2_i1:186-1835(+)
MDSPDAPRKQRTRSHSTSAVRRKSLTNPTVQGLSSSLDSTRFKANVLKASNGKTVKRKAFEQRFRSQNNYSPVESPLGVGQGHFNYGESPVPFSPATLRRHQFANSVEDREQAAALDSFLHLHQEDSTDSALGHSYASPSKSARRSAPSLTFLGQANAFDDDLVIQSVATPLDDSSMSDTNALDSSMTTSARSAAATATRYPPLFSSNEDTSDVFASDFTSVPDSAVETDPSLSSPRLTVFRAPHQQRALAYPKPQPAQPLLRSASVPGQRHTDRSPGMAGPLSAHGNRQAEPFRLFRSESCVLSRPMYELPKEFDQSKPPVQLHLPTTGNVHIKNKSIRDCYISADTFVDLIRGDYNQHFDQHLIFDCRFPFEYNGGHIAGAFNIWLRENLIRVLFSDPAADLTEGHRVAIIFHCEFSAQRGPDQYHFARLVDEWITQGTDQRIFPQMYILQDGYKEFYRQYPHLCTNYVPMDDSQFKSDLSTSKNELNASQLGAREGRWLEQPHIVHLRTQIEAGKTVDQLQALPRRHGGGGENSPCTPASQVKMIS